jgi:hypothetical protein
MTVKLASEMHTRDLEEMHSQSHATHIVAAFTVIQFQLTVANQALSVSMTSDGPSSLDNYWIESGTVIRMLHFPIL